MNVLLEFDERPILVRLPREITRRQSRRPADKTKWSKKRRRTPFTRMAATTKIEPSGNLTKPNLKRASSLPAKLENAPPTKRLFWFRPGPSSYFETIAQINPIQGIEAFSQPGDGSKIDGVLALRKDEPSSNGQIWRLENLSGLPKPLEDDETEDLIGLAFVEN